LYTDVLALCGIGASYCPFASFSRARKYHTLWPVPSGLKNNLGVFSNL
jgi:hypothetical protein